MLKQCTIAGINTASSSRICDDLVNMLSYVQRNGRYCYRFCMLSLNNCTTASDIINMCGGGDILCSPLHIHNAHTLLVLPSFMWNGQSL